MGWLVVGTEWDGHGNGNERRLEQSNLRDYERVLPWFDVRAVPSCYDSLVNVFSCHAVVVLLPVYCVAGGTPLDRQTAEEDFHLQIR